MNALRADVASRWAAVEAYDGVTATELASMLALPRVVAYDEVPSTLDVAHALGDAGAPSGTLVLADSQSAGRGRMGRTWHSEPGRGIWLTLLERPTASETLSVLSLRIALALAPVLDAFASAKVMLKWPNDLYVADRKLAGVLVEARWRGARLDWLAVGVGINLQAPEAQEAAFLARGTKRVAVLRAVVAALRRVVARVGPLTPDELADFGARDLAMGRRCETPARGTVLGIDPDGALLIETDAGRASFHAGSLLMVDDVKVR